MDLSTVLNRIVKATTFFFLSNTNFKKILLEFKYIPCQITKQIHNGNIALFNESQELLVSSTETFFKWLSIWCKLIINYLIKIKSNGAVKYLPVLNRENQCNYKVCKWKGTLPRFVTRVNWIVNVWRERVEWSSSQQKVCFRYKNFGSLRGALPPSHRLLCCRSASIPSHLGSIVQGR